MKALRFDKLGSLDALELVETEIPERGDDEVLVEIKAAGLNPSDFKNVLGRFPYTTLPRTPGRDFSGVIVDGPVDLLAKEVWGCGRELGFTRDGSHAEYMTLPIKGVAIKPKSLSFSQAASCGVPYIAAWNALERTNVAEGTTILIIGGTGAVGSAAIAIAKTQGATILAAVRRKATAEMLESRDIRTLLLKDSGSLPDMVRAIIPNGVNVVFDTTGFWLAESIPALARFGRIAVIAAPPDGLVNLPVLKLYRSGGSVIGVDTMLFDTQACAGFLNPIGSYFDEGKLPPPTGFRECLLDNAIDAYREIERGTSTRVVFV